MTTLAWLLALTLWTIAVIHAYWGLGGVWPAADEISLARAVVGARGVRRMPSPIACAVVAVVLLAAGAWPLMLQNVWPTPLPPWLLGWGGGVIAAILLARGIVANTAPWRRLTPELPFATLDRRIFGPLSIALGLGFVALLTGGLY